MNIYEDSPSDEHRLIMQISDAAEKLVWKVAFDTNDKPLAGLIIGTDDFCNNYIELI